MSKRYYCPQFCHKISGWTDLPSLASFKEKEAIKNMEEFQNQRSEMLAMRVIRKAHGWQPNNEEK
jgi:cytochrome c553